MYDVGRTFSVDAGMLSDILAFFWIAGRCTNGKGRPILDEMAGAQIVKADHVRVGTVSVRVRWPFLSNLNRFDRRYWTT